MITIQITFRKCNSGNIVKNGYNSAKNPKYKYKDCGFGGIASKRKSETEKEQQIKVSHQKKSNKQWV